MSLPTTKPAIEIFEPGDFEAERHFYPRALNAHLHPLVASFQKMSIDRLVSRYCHLHPLADRAALTDILTTAPRYLRWSGSDILNVSNEQGVRLKLVLETNSCPSGQKSFPTSDGEDEDTSYRSLIEHTFLPLVRQSIRQADESGVLAVLYDKNHMESTGYAQALATLTKRPVWLVPSLQSDPGRYLIVKDRRLYVQQDDDAALHAVVCAFRYVTQRPWTRLPFNLKTPILNPIVACLAGGRNKTAAYKSFEVFNAAFRSDGLEINAPETFTNVRKAEIPMLVTRLGGRAVVKVPYLNAGQGIFTIVHDGELDAFMEVDHEYDEFIVQQLVGNFLWSSTSARGRVYHIGTVPDRKNQIYSFDLRVMVAWGDGCFRPIALYARRAPAPLSGELSRDEPSWRVLGTNLSRKVSDDEWEIEPRRLLMMDRKDFSRLGLGLDDLIESFIQAVMANRAIDDMAKRLVKRGGSLRRELLLSLCNDAHLLDEVR